MRHALDESSGLAVDNQSAGASGEPRLRTPLLVIFRGILFGLQKLFMCVRLFASVSFLLEA